MSSHTKKKYGERDSPFFCLRSQNKLADLLFISKSTIRNLARSENCYSVFEKSKVSGGVRTISAPKSHLKSVQSRIAELLQRIKTPKYLYAPVTGRSYVDNAAVHRGAANIYLLDIEDFFPNCTANKVFWIFHKRMQCSLDVAAILCGLVTKDGSLPQGSPCSPILSYFCNMDMWQEIAESVKKAECHLSVYLDDLTVSGQNVSNALKWEIKKTLFKHGFRYNKKKERSKMINPAEVTGVIIHGYELEAPNRQYKAIYDLRQELNQGKVSNEDREALKAQLRGRESQMQQIASQNFGN